jgi:hypothetical protein
VDSWTVGAIADDAVVARVLLRLWPPRVPDWPVGRRRSP